MFTRFTATRLGQAACALALAAGFASCVIVIGDHDFDHDDGFSTSYRSGPRITGSGVHASEERAVEEFSEVFLTGSIDVEVTVGSRSAVVIEGDDNLLAHVKTNVSDGRLEVALERGSYRMKRGILVRVETPHLNAVELAGSGDLTASGIDAAEFSARLSGSGDVTAEGRADHVSVSVLGSGDMDLGGLHALRGSVSLVGSGDAEVDVSEELDLSLVGSGDVAYRGSPQVRLSRSGSGDVQRKD